MKTFEELESVKESHALLVGKNAIRESDKKVYLILSLSIQPTAPDKIILAPADEMDHYEPQGENDVFVSVVAIDLEDNIILPLGRFFSDFTVQY